MHGLDANIDLNEKWNLISIHEGFTREKQLQALQNESRYSCHDKIAIIL